MEAAIHDCDTLLNFGNSIAEVANASEKELAVASARMPIDAKFDRLRAVRRRAERKCRRTKLIQDLRNARRVHK